MQQTADQTHYRQTASLLGYLGLLPFIALTLMLIVGVQPDLAVDALRFYAATILVFVGAIHWGTSLYSGDPSAALVSVGVALYAWICLMLGDQWSLLGLTIGFVAVYAHDFGKYRDTAAWFGKLRRNLTLVVALSLTLSVVTLLLRPESL